jgi:hypothetical protein
MSRAKYDPVRAKYDPVRPEEMDKAPAPPLQQTGAAGGAPGGVQGGAERARGEDPLRKGMPNDRVELSDASYPFAK